MSAPAIGSLVGSWLFVRASVARASDTMIYHFDAQGGNHWELDWPDSARDLTFIRYSFAGSSLTLHYKSGSTRDFPLLQECDGTVRITSYENKLWWMRRLRHPMPYSIAFIGDDGLLKRSLMKGFV